MASFREEAAAAAEALARLNREADRTAKGEQKREQERERSFAGAALGLVGGVGGLARGLTPAAQALSAGGLGDAADVASASLLEAAARSSLGQIAGGYLGINRQLNARVSARDQVIDELSPLAAANVPLDEGAMQRLIDLRVAQQERVEALKANVTAKTAFTPVDAAIGALGEDKITAAMDRFVGAIDKLEAFMATLPFVSRSGGQ